MQVIYYVGSFACAVYYDVQLYMLIVVIQLVICLHFCHFLFNVAGSGLLVVSIESIQIKELRCSLLFASRATSWFATNYP